LALHGTKNNNDMKIKVKSDFDEIQKNLVNDNRLESKFGTYVQTRTKGPKNSNSRAFYFKVCFVKEFLMSKIEYTDDIKQKITEIIKP
jgi:hypothetical protein